MTKKLRGWCPIMKAIVDNVRELRPHQRYARIDTGGHTGWDRCALLCHIKLTFFFRWDVFLIKFFLSILKKRMCVWVSFIKFAHIKGHMEEGAHWAWRKIITDAATIQNPQKKVVMYSEEAINHFFWNMQSSFWHIISSKLSQNI